MSLSQFIPQVLIISIIVYAVFRHLKQIDKTVLLINVFIRVWLMYLNGPRVCCNISLYYY
jgi:hypothetical protein